MKNKLLNVLEKEGFQVNDNILDKFIDYAYLLKEWNKNINLTANDSDEDIIYKHFLDSLLCLKTNIEWKGKVIDVGTGAGFPGIPIKIFKDLNLFLLDSLKKRISFLTNVINKLELKNVTCIHGRAEEIARDELYRETFDIVVARAVAKLPVLLEICLPFLKQNGYFLALKGPEGENELEECKTALKTLGGNLYKIEKFNLADINHKRTIIIFQKISPTPLKYPRKPGIPQKRPLGILNG